MQAAVPYCYISKRMIDKFNELKDKTDSDLKPKTVELPTVVEETKDEETLPQKTMPSKFKSKKAAPTKKIVPKAPPKKMIFSRAPAPVPKEPEPVNREIVANLSDEEIEE